MADKETKTRDFEHVSTYMSDTKIIEQIEQSPRGVTSEYARKKI